MYHDMSMTDEYAFGPRLCPFCCLTPRLFAVAEGKLGIVRAFANAKEVTDMPEMFGIWNTVPEPAGEDGEDGSGWGLMNSQRWMFIP